MKCMAYSGIDPWFLVQIEDIVMREAALVGREFTSIAYSELRQLKRKGFSDARLASLLGTTESAFRASPPWFESAPCL